MNTHAPEGFSRYRFSFWLIGLGLFFVFLWLTRSILLPFVVGMMTAYFLDPAVRKLHALGWPRGVSAGVITVSFFVLAMGVGSILVPLIVHQLAVLLGELPDYVRGLQSRYSEEVEYYFSRLGHDQIATIKHSIGTVGNNFAVWAGAVASHALKSGLALLNILLLVFITPVVAFYLLRDWDQFVAHCDGLLPREQAPVIRQQLLLIDRTLSGFIRGQTNVCLLMASYYGVTLSLIGLKFGLLIGLMTGLMMFIPFVGYATGFTLSLIVAFFQFDDSVYYLMVVAVYILGMLLESSLITPRLVGSKVGLHPLWIIFGMLAGATLFGFVGILIAVPLTAVIGVLIRFAVSRYLQSPLYMDLSRKRK